jgi:hypothetical protein
VGVQWGLWLAEHSGAAVGVGHVVYGGGKGRGGGGTYTQDWWPVYSLLYMRSYFLSVYYICGCTCRRYTIYAVVLVGRVRPVLWLGAAGGVQAGGDPDEPEPVDHGAGGQQREHLHAGRVPRAPTAHHQADEPAATVCECYESCSRCIVIS